MDRFRSTGMALLGPSPTSVRRRRVEPFVRFLPLAWLAAASRVEGSRHALAVGVLLHYRKGLTHSDSVEPPTRWLRAFGVDRHACYRALCALGSAGLVRIDRRRGKKPIITILSLGVADGGEPHDAID